MNQMKSVLRSNYPSTPYRAGILWITLVTRGALLSFLWWSLTDGKASSWWVGVPAVGVVLMVSVALVPPVYLSWRGVFRFVPFFLVRSLMGGVDVAWRAFHPSLPNCP